MKHLQFIYIPQNIVDYQGIYTYPLSRLENNNTFSPLLIFRGCHRT